MSRTRSDLHIQPSFTVGLAQHVWFHKIDALMFASPLCNDTRGPEAAFRKYQHANCVATTRVK
jgi:hypothetical protein